MIDAKGSNLAFVTGCPRSGTTWLHRLIASHPLVSTGQESNLFDFYIGPQLKTWRDESKLFNGRGPNGLHCYLKEQEFLGILRKYAVALLGNVRVKGKGIFLEKTPSHVCFFKEINEIFPKAKIIIINRHPFDVISSLLRVGKSWGPNWAPKNVLAASRMWKGYTKCAISSEHYLPKDNLYVTNFERLKRNGIEVIKELFEFLDLNCTDQEAANFLESNRPGNPKMTKIPLYGEYEGKYIVEPDGFYKKKDSDYRLPLVSKLIITAICKREMGKLGYRFK